MQSLITPVVIIGAGPAGLVSSLLLSKYRVHHVLVEKYVTMAHTPRAHIINQRTVEILRDLGLEDAFHKIAMPWAQMTNTVWHVSLAGRELGRRRSWGTGPDRHSDYVRASPCPMANCGQHLLEPMLLEAAKSSPYADIRLGSEFTSLRQDADGIDVVVTARGDQQQTTLRAEYLIGADGGRSAVATAVGLKYDGESDLGHSATIHFEADLSTSVAYRPGTLYWNAVPGTSNFRGAGNLICHQPWHEWALAFSYDPATLDPLDRDAAIRRLRAITGDADLVFEIKNISTWVINKLVAQQYSVGRVFCMGDAVHRHPPTNGLGLNTSVGDAYNLAWKLAMVLKGDADPALLDSYSRERQPVGAQIVDRAYASIGDMSFIAEALGFTNGQTSQDGERALAALAQPGATGEQCREDLDSALARTDHQFNAHGVEVGFRYRTGALISDGSPEPIPDRDPELFYHPTTWPGSHLPHAWLAVGNQQLSTFDVAGDGRFVLLTGVGGDAWRQAAAAVAEQLGLPLKVIAIGTPDGYRDIYRDWSRLREVSDTGCVLVRPDLHVAWRAFDDSWEKIAELPKVMRQILGLSSALQPERS